MEQFGEDESLHKEFGQPAHVEHLLLGQQLFSTAYKHFSRFRLIMDVVGWCSSSGWCWKFVVFTIITRSGWKRFLLILSKVVTLGHHR
jgi:hypothetical protein